MLGGFFSWVIVYLAMAWCFLEIDATKWTWEQRYLSLITYIITMALQEFLVIYKARNGKNKDG